MSDMSNTVWKSEPIEHEGMTLEVSATEGQVDIGKTVTGLYASDMVLPSAIARAWACAIWQAANESDKAKG